MSDYEIRKGKEQDVSELLALILELAIYEKEADAVDITEQQLAQDIFGPEAIVDFLVADKEGEIMGIAIFYQKYSTWKGRCLFLEDLVVREKYRRLGIGKALFDKLVAEARTLGSMRLEWQVLSWNEPAIQFYKKINAQLDGEWINCKLDKDQLEKYKR